MARYSPSKNMYDGRLVFLMLEWVVLCRKGRDRWFWGHWPQHERESDDGWIIRGWHWFRNHPNQGKVHSSEAGPVQPRLIRLHHKAPSVLSSPRDLGRGCWYSHLYQIRLRTGSVCLCVVELKWNSVRNKCYISAPLFFPPLHWNC